MSSDRPKVRGTSRAHRGPYPFGEFPDDVCMAGVPITTVKELMGHASIQTTMRYALHFSAGHKEAAIDRLPY